MSANPKNVDEAKPANNRDNDGAKDPETGTTGESRALYTLKGSGESWRRGAGSPDVQSFARGAATRAPRSRQQEPQGQLAKAPLSLLGLLAAPSPPRTPAPGPGPLGLPPPSPLWLLTCPGAPQTGKPYEIAPEDAHMRTDSKDERSIKNKIVDAHREEKKQEQADEDKQKTDPTEIARSHGNEPSRGAKIDKKIEDDEEELLRKKDEAKKQAEEAAKGKGHGK